MGNSGAEPAKPGVRAPRALRGEALSDRGSGLAARCAAWAGVRDRNRRGSPNSGFVLAVAGSDGCCVLAPVYEMSEIMRCDRDRGRFRAGWRIRKVRWTPRVFSETSDTPPHVIVNHSSLGMHGSVKVSKEARRILLAAGLLSVCSRCSNCNVPSAE